MNGCARGRPFSRPQVKAVGGKCDSKLTVVYFMSRIELGRVTTGHGTEPKPGIHIMKILQNIERHSQEDTKREKNTVEAKLKLAN